ncbi:endonuclease MutS2 [Ruminococcaceae bacterium OttesenSCG-928-A16]|nr:endonuclease MutS2 [Ruminococcaceae bacterium OttesenSCG-928-A16]
MNKKYLKNIELDKIVEMAVERAVCDEAKQMLLQEAPYTRPDDVRQVLSQTDALASHLLKNGNPRISSCGGASNSVSRAAKGGVLSMAELLAVSGALRNFSALASWFGPGEGISTPVDDLFFAITPQPTLEKAIPEAILSDTEMADTASDELYSLRRKIRVAEGSIRDKLDSVIKNQNNSKYLQEAVVSIRNGRFVVPVKAEHRNEIGGVIHDVSSSGGTLFVEPTAVVEANAKILQLRNQEQAEIERILGEFSEQVAGIAPFFEVSYSAMLEVDKRIAKAELGLAMNGVCPKVNDAQGFSLVKARHPLISKDVVVPVDITLGENYDTMIITGPNTGGKTVSLKTAGLLCTMAQLGYLIPAHDSSTVCVFGQILVDIGDEQSIEQSLSTFSGHMKNITEILRVVDDKSLVLLDELGAGTDPAEGAALAIAVIERLRATGARIMATTHYAELKMFALDTPGVQNAGSEFDIETLRPTYRLVVGVPGRSNAFLISEKLGIPESVIESARAHMSNEQRRFETVLTQLEDLKLEFKEQQDEIERLKYTATHQLEAAQKQRDALIRQGEEELAQARQKAKALADDVQNKAYRLMDEIKQIEKQQRTSNAQKAQRAREIARKDAEDLLQRAAKGETSTPKTFVPLKAAAPGQEVYMPEMDKLATVITGPDKAGLVEIRMGAIKTKVPLAKLSAAPKLQKTEKKPRRMRGAASPTPAAQQTTGIRTPQMEINLLGKTVNEALLETDQFIDAAVISGLTPLYIIHGRGTGALRSAIQQHLRSNKSVKSFRLGQYGEGEDGVTVVELK